MSLIYMYMKLSAGVEESKHKKFGFTCPGEDQLPPRAAATEEIPLEPSTFAGAIAEICLFPLIGGKHQLNPSDKSLS